MSHTESTPSLGKVVVVGGCGFLGGHIVNLIVKRHPQTQVAVLDLRTNSNRNASHNVSYHDGDITDLSAMKALFSQIRPDAVIHTASPHFDLKPEIHDKVNVGGTKNLLEAAQVAGVKAFVYTSSASVILDAVTELVNADERWPLVTGKAQPEHYTTTKVRSQLMTQADAILTQSTGLRGDSCTRGKPQTGELLDVRHPPCRHLRRRRRTASSQNGHCLPQRPDQIPSRR